MIQVIFGINSQGTGATGCGKAWQISIGMYHDLTWLVEGLEVGTIEWCTDGSYHRGRAPNISGAGWMVCDTAPLKPGEKRRCLTMAASGKSPTVQTPIERNNCGCVSFIIR